MSTTADAAAIKSIGAAIGILDAADATLAETIDNSVLDNRTEVAEARVGLLVVREFLAAMAKAAVDA